MPHLVLRNYVLSSVEPVVGHGLYEMALTSPSHAMFEVAATSFLMGRGYDFRTALRLVESWEVSESFPPFQVTPGYYYPHSF